MYSISLWNKATEIGSKLKAMASYENISQEQFDNIKNENKKLKEELDERNNKYQSILNDIAQKEAQKPLSQNEIENFYNKLCQDFKSFLLIFFPEDQDYIDLINEIFINVQNEKFFEKIYKLNQIIKPKIFSEILISNKESIIQIIEEKEEIIEKINNYSTQINKNKENIEENEFNIFEYLFNELLIIKKSKEEKINQLEIKIVNNEEKLKSLNDNIEKMQNDGRKAFDAENKLNEIINNLEKEKNELIEKNNELKGKIDEFVNEKINFEKENSSHKEQIKNLLNQKEEIENKNEELNKVIIITKNENERFKRQIEDLNQDIALYSDNNYIINEKNEEISKKTNEIEKLIASYKILEEEKNTMEKEKNEEIEIYKNQILSMTNEIAEQKEKNIESNQNEDIEKIYIGKIFSLESQLNKIQEENLNLKKKEEERKKEMDNLIKKVNLDLKNTEYLIDKRVISSVLVNYFDKNSNETVKQSLLETLSSLMDYSNEDRKKMGLKPINIPNKNDKNDKLKTISDGLYDFILNN
jgi:chromosome segregation ATPase